MNIEEKLKKSLKEFKYAPFLFIGSGFSRRYLGLPDWENLLSGFCKIHLKKPYNYYSSKASGDLPKVATYMAKDFFEIWWHDPIYQESRNKYQDKMKNEESPFKLELSKYVHKLSEENNIEPKLHREIEEFKQINIDGIITTNWDLFLQEELREHIEKVYVGQDELIFSNTLELAEIYKIHGCINQFETIIVTEKDYEDFNEKYTYLTAKLITIFMEHPIIFIGYSLSDSNIQQIFSSILKLMSEHQLEKFSQRLFFVQRIKEREEKLEIVPINISSEKITLQITKIETDNFDKVFRATNGIRRAIPTKIYRKLKSQVYELIKTHDPDEKIYGTIDYKNMDSENLEFVYGVGIHKTFKGDEEKHYIGIGARELFLDVLREELELDFNSIVRKTLPSIISIDNYVPIYRYIAESKISGKTLPEKLKPSTHRYNTLNKILSSFEKKKRKEQTLNISDLPSDKIERFQKMIYLDYDKMSESEIDDFKVILKEYINLYDEKDLNDEYGAGYKTLYRKYIRIYDLIRWKGKCKE